jgi:hypothetical protein
MTEWTAVPGGQQVWQAKKPGRPVLQTVLHVWEARIPVLAEMKGW